MDHLMTTCDSTSVHIETKRLLIVDDEEPIRNLLERILSADGFDCRMAVDAAEGRRLMQQQPADLVLSDINMPGESGLDFIKFVKTAYPDTGVVIVSVISEPEVARTAVETGIYGYLLKPFQRDQVLITVKNALRRSALEIREKNRCRELERMVYQRTTELLEMQDRLRRRDMELKTQKHTLKRAETALQAIMDYRLRDRLETEETVLTNVKQAVKPYLEKLRRSSLTNRQVRYLDILEGRIQDIVSPFIRALSSTYVDLSPTELQVAQLIKEGRTTKEIAVILNLSANTVMTHRYKIRTKLGLKRQHQNLHVFLKSLGNQ